MKKLFYLGVLLLALFELANVWFIMPLPYSQRVRSIDIAYALHSGRWIFRSIFALMILAGIAPAWRAPGWRKAIVVVGLALVAVVSYGANNVMAADKMFIAPK